MWIWLNMIAVDRIGSIQVKRILDGVQTFTAQTSIVVFRNKSTLSSIQWDACAMTIHNGFVQARKSQQIQWAKRSVLGNRTIRLLKKWLNVSSLLRLTLEAKKWYMNWQVFWLTPVLMPSRPKGQWPCRWFQDVDWSFTAAGLSGICTRFPFIVFSWMRNDKPILR